MLLAGLLKSVITYGDMTVIDATGRAHRFKGRPFKGIPDAFQPAPFTIRLHDKSLHWKLLLRPTLYAGEAYMDGTLTVEDGSLYDFLATFVHNAARAPRGNTLGLERWSNRALRWLHQHNPLGKAADNVAHHYDLSAELYDLFLDVDKQYSCAYFQTGGETLEQAQEAKKHHIARKMMLKPGHRVLDIGCGWGGMGLTLARDFNVQVQGVTLSREQLAVARARARAANLSGKVDFSLRDYRFEDSRYDRIVSVGMFEHVGANHYAEFFERVRDLLTDDGVCLLHTIGRTTPPGGTNAWLRKYIFPGGYTPALSEVMTEVEKAGLIVNDVEILRDHYALTLREWAKRFQARRAEAARLYDERFCRMWEFYLIGSEVCFRFDDQVVFQLQITKDRHVLPETRDYMYLAPQAPALQVVGGGRRPVTARRPGGSRTAATPCQPSVSARSRAAMQREE